jgi:hypothetical protein
VATAVLSALAETEREVPDTAALRAAAGAIVERWREAVADDLRRAPVTGAELAALERAAGRQAAVRRDCCPRLAYGTTLLAVLLASRYVAYFQLGDGDLLAVSHAGEVTRPLSADGRLFANETTSLCAGDASEHFRVGAHRLDEGAEPALILLATDGYANSFRDDLGFCQVGSDLLEIIRAYGVQAVEGSLEAWLEEATQLGSGDDVSVGILCRLDAVEGEAEADHGTEVGSDGVVDSPLAAADHPSWGAGARDAPVGPEHGAGVTDAAPAGPPGPSQDECPVASG